MNRIGLRKEEKSFETRVPIVPDHVRLLNEQHGIEFVLEPSNQRAFKENEYQAKVMPLKGSGTPVVLGIKEMPIDFFEENVVYIFFSHTIKGQDYNMPMPKRLNRSLIASVTGCKVWCSWPSPNAWASTTI